MYFHVHVQCIYSVYLRGLHSPEVSCVPCTVHQQRSGRQCALEEPHNWSQSTNNFTMLCANNSICATGYPGTDKLTYKCTCIYMVLEIANIHVYMPHIMSLVLCVNCVYTYMIVQCTCMYAVELFIHMQCQSILPESRVSSWSQCVVAMR